MNRTWAEGLSFYYPRLLYCPDQILAEMLLSRYRVSSSKNVRSRAPCCAQCMGNAIRTWTAVCSAVPYSQFNEGARPHEQMESPNTSPRVLELNPSCSGKAHPNRPGTEYKSREPGKILTILHVLFMVFPLRSANAKSGKIIKRFRYDHPEKKKESSLLANKKKILTYCTFLFYFILSLYLSS